MFDFLAKVDSCCFCCSLKVGCIFIAIASIFGTFGSLTLSPVCDEKRGAIQDAVTYIYYALLGITCVVSLLALIFLIEVCMDNGRAIATLFLIAIVLFLIIQLATMIAVVVATIMLKDCDRYFPLLLALYSYPTWIYFIIVVRSYQEEDTY